MQRNHENSELISLSSSSSSSSPQRARPHEPRHHVVAPRPRDCRDEAEDDQKARIKRPLRTEEAARHHNDGGGAAAPMNAMASSSSATTGGSASTQRGNTVLVELLDSESDNDNDEDNNKHQCATEDRTKRPDVTSQTTTAVGTIDVLDVDDDDAMTSLLPNNNTAANRRGTNLGDTTTTTMMMTPHRGRGHSNALSLTPSSAASSAQHRTPPGGVPRHLLEEAMAFSMATTSNSHDHLLTGGREGMYLPRDAVGGSNNNNNSNMSHHANLLGRPMNSNNNNNNNKQGDGSLMDYASLLSAATAHVMAAASATTSTHHHGNSTAPSRPLVTGVSLFHEEGDALTAATLQGLLPQLQRIHAQKRGMAASAAAAAAAAVASGGGGGGAPSSASSSSVAAHRSLGGGNDFVSATQIHQQRSSVSMAAAGGVPYSSASQQPPPLRSCGGVSVSMVNSGGGQSSSLGNVANVFGYHGGGADGGGGRRSFDIGVVTPLGNRPNHHQQQQQQPSGIMRVNPYLRVSVAAAAAPSRHTSQHQTQLSSAPSSLMSLLSGNSASNHMNRPPKIATSAPIQAAMQRLQSKGVQWMRHVDGRIAEKRSVFEASCAYHPNLTLQDVNDFVLMIGNMPDISQGLPITAGMREGLGQRGSVDDDAIGQYIGSAATESNPHHHDPFGAGSGFVRTFGPAAHPAIYAFSLSRDALTNDHSSKSNAATAAGFYTSDGGQRTGGAMQRMLPANEGFDDNGEVGAGTRVLGVCQRMQLEGWVVVLARWYGGILLGPARFQHIQNVTSACVRAGKAQFGV